MDFPHRHKHFTDDLMCEAMQDMLVLPLLAGALGLGSGVDMPKLLDFMKRGWYCSLQPLANDCVHLHSGKLNRSGMLQLATRRMEWWPHILTDLHKPEQNCPSPNPPPLEQIRDTG